MEQIKTAEERLREFVEMVADLTLAGEADLSGKAFQPTPEDSAETITSLILTARELLDHLKQA